MNIKKLIPKSIKNSIKLIDGLLFSTLAKSNKNYKCTKDTKRCFYNKKSPNYKYEYFGKNTPICCATHLYNILKDVTKVLEESNLEYFISFGTLLGAVRHKGLIPWDTDVDIVIAQKDNQEILKTLKDKLGLKYYIKEDIDYSIVGKKLIRVYLSKINSLHIDLFFYKEQEDLIIFGFNRKIKKSKIYPLKKIDFYDLKLFAPADIDFQLNLFYGSDYMEYAYKQWAFNKSKFKITNYLPAKIDND